MDILHSLTKQGFQFQSKTGYHLDGDSRLSRTVLFNRLLNDISINGSLFFYRHSQSVDFKIQRIDLSSSKDGRLKTIADNEVPVEMAKDIVLALLEDNKIMEV